MSDSIDRIGGENLSIKNLDFSYNGKLPIYEKFDIDIEPGEFVSVIGPSGCGKTTLLNLLSGFYKPEGGSVLLRGKQIAPEDPKLGYVFQQATLFPWLSAIENVEFGLKMIGMGAEERRERALKYFKLVGLSGFEDYLVMRLSGGMQQRASLARTLAMEPQLLLMDEPFGALDAITRETMNDELLRIWDDLGQTVLFITHDIDEAIYLSDRILILNRPPKGIYKDIKNELPRPRIGASTRTSDLFWQYKKELIDDITKVQEAAPLNEEEAMELRNLHHENNVEVN